MIGGLGPMEIALICLALILLFGSRKIPELARGLGSGIVEFRDALRADRTGKAVASSASEEEKP